MVSKARKPYCDLSPKQELPEGFTWLATPYQGTRNIALPDGSVLLVRLVKREETYSPEDFAILAECAQDEGETSQW